ncbi:23S rRNA (guanosine(2251)-2'-O)-methyltransferase RlmB [Fannyhessea vaginae]|uniref:23S rRNA (guanosine(2251)-2'-O)-methyltransferase RlmB n=1 Tax=Fannyhessea vaginae TaxID=82135 RepID=UPI003A8110F4
MAQTHNSRGNFKKPTRKNKNVQNARFTSNEEGAPYKKRARAFGDSGTRARSSSTNARSFSSQKRSSGVSPAHMRPRRERGARAPMIEGRRACFEALEAHLPLKKLLVQENMNAALQTADVERLITCARERGIACEYVKKSAMDTLSSHGAHQGVMFETAPFAYAELSDVLAAIDQKDVRAAGASAADASAADANKLVTNTDNQPVVHKQASLVVLLDHVVDEGNFGAIVRSAEVVGASCVIIANARCASVGVGAYKTSAGAVLHMPIVQVVNLARAIDELKEHGFWVIGASEHAQQTVWNAPFSGNVCLVMGSEENGISSLVQKKCDFICKLPQRGRIESLNVAQAATVMCYEWMRQNTLSV